MSPTPSTPALGPPPTTPAGRTFVHVEQVMGTVVSFHVPERHSASEERTAALVAESCRLLHRADLVFSTWREESPISRLRRGEVDVDSLAPEVATVLSLCRQARAWSCGWFDPWAMPGGVDPTGLVKGWALEQALGVLQAGGLEAALVNGGGDLAAFGQPAPGDHWRVGVRHPWRRDALACVVRLDQAIATSAGYERGEHLIDPHTGRPGTRAASATVVGPSLALADALATALAVGGDEVLAAVEQLEGYGAYLVRPDGSEVSTEDMAFEDMAFEDAVFED
jgi:thiamine biosynthesis lipoprotein